jgi:hypothetical protein
MGLAKKIFSPPPIAGLYEADYSRWLFENARLLREGRFSEADIANIAEELEDMGRSEKRAVASHLGVVLMHLLKWQFQPDHRNSSWRGSIHNARRAIAKLLNESPSLQPQMPDMIAVEYEDARYNAVLETGLPEETLPKACPFTSDEVLHLGYWPGPEG